MKLKYLKDYKPYKVGDIVETTNAAYAKFVISKKIAVVEEEPEEKTKKKK